MQGFTLLELLVVLAIGSAVLSTGLIYGISSYNRLQKNNDADVILTTLYHARAEARNGVCVGECTKNLSYGIHTTNATVTIFAGDSFNTRDISSDEVFTLSGHSKISGDLEIVFMPLTASCLANSSLTITNSPVSRKTLRIYPSGEIQSL